MINRWTERYTDLDARQTQMTDHCCLVAKLYLTLCDPIDCGPPGSSVHGIFQARILEWVATSFSQMERDTQRDRETERQRERQRKKEREMLFSSCGAGKTKASLVSFWDQKPQKGLHHWRVILAFGSNLESPGRLGDSG